MKLIFYFSLFFPPSVDPARTVYIDAAYSGGAPTVTIYTCVSPQKTSLSIPLINALDPEFKVLPAVNLLPSGIMSDPVETMESSARRIDSVSIQKILGFTGIIASILFFY